jgi:hypothetical protein
LFFVMPHYGSFEGGIQPHIDFVLGLQLAGE